MQGGRRGQDNFFEFGDPFAGFRRPSAMGQGSLLSGFFGGRDPFDDPFFTSPFGSSFGSLFQSNFFGPGSGPFADAPAHGFLEHQPPQPDKRRGPVIEELNSDDEKAVEDGMKDKKENPRKHGRSDKEPYVEHPDDEAQERKSRHVQSRNMYYGRSNAQSLPRSHSFTFQSSTVTYGGVDGAYHTKSSTRRTGSDGVSFEEYKEADSSTRQATHQISRGLNDKGHTFMRKLNSDGRVDTMQTLHNLKEDELTGFEEAWKGNARKHLPGWSTRLEGRDNSGPSSSRWSGQPSRGGWALPSTVSPQQPGRVNLDMRSGTAAHSQPFGGRNPYDGSRG
ncbi:hypothetical protein Ancab_032517 [Ancistrocladus abbreviatus]